MGAAYFPVLEREIEGLTAATAISGKAIARASEELDELAQAANVKPLSEFISMSAAHVFGSIGEPVPPEFEGKEAELFSASDGLTTVRALLGRVARDELKGDAKKWAARICDDLKGLEGVLVQAEKLGIRFRLSVDV